MAEVALVRVPFPQRAIVQLRLSMPDARAAAAELELASPLQVHIAGDYRSLWLGPDQWLLVSDRLAASAMLERCATALGSFLHLAVDASAAWYCETLAGARVRDLLAMGAGIDWSPRAMPGGRCVRTRFARIAAVFAAAAADRFDVYVDRSHRDYLDRWLANAVQDPLLREP
jgi:sarcosine oxidase subunit gamma